MKPSAVLAAMTGLLALGGCVVVPQGPTAMVMPGTGKNLELFQVDVGVCREYAHASIGGATQAAQNNAGASVAGGAAMGAAVGALFGAATGNAGAGAAWGAGTGMMIGGAGAGNYGYASSYTLQRQYDIAYLQCMYTRGNQVPAYASSRTARSSSAPPPARYNAPPNAIKAPPNTPAPSGYTSPSGYSVPRNAQTPPPNTPPPPGAVAPASN